MKNKNKWLIILLTVIIGLSITTCDTGNNSSNNYSGGNGDSMPTGFYLGLIGFNDEVTLKETRYLSSGNRDQFQTFISRLEIDLATGLYFAVDKAINSLQAAKLPDDIKSVSIITFTDGLDDDSTELNSNYATQEEYRAAIVERIANTKIRNLPINAFSIGMKGTDVTAANPAFQNSLADLASGSANAYTVTSMQNAVSRFITIADDLYKAREAGKSDVVMLILDCTSSLDENSANGFYYVKDAAYNFINTLCAGVGEAGAGTDIASAALITAGQWKNSTLPGVNSMDFYKVSVSAGIPYYFWWNDKDNHAGSGAAADVEVSFSSDGTKWSNWIDSAWIPNEGFNYPVYRSGILYIRVRPYSAFHTGAYAITYRAYANFRPF